MRRALLERPENFEINTDHQLAHGMVLGGFGRHTKTTRYQDSSPYGNHGTLTNMDPATDWIWSSELGRWVLDFDGTLSQCVTANDSASWNASAATFSCWVKYATVGANTNALFSKGRYSSTRSWSYFMDQRAATGDTAQLRFWHANTGSDAGNNYTYTDYITLLNRWKHICWVYNGSAPSLILYVDGVLQTGLTTAGTIPVSVIDSTDYFTIGRGLLGLERYVTGSISDMVIYNSALTLPEIRILANRSDPMLGGLILPPKRKLWAVSGGAAPVTNRRRRVICGACQ